MRKTIKLFMLLVIVTSSYLCTAQGVLTVFPDWSSTTGSQNFFYKNVTKTDASNNVYIAGATMNGYGNYDILLVKYNSAGTLQWTVQYNGAGNGQDIATGLYIDGSGNVYITGEITTSSSVDIVTAKYNSSGTQQWMSTYNGTGASYDCGADVIVDGSGNVYITGSSYNASSNTDVETIKYNSSGVQQWAKRYDYTSNLNDAGVKIAFDAGSNVVVSCVVETSSTAYNYGVLTYNRNTGTLTGGTISGSCTTGITEVNDMVVDASGNIYIAGALPVTGHGYDYDVIKLNSSLGIAWERTYNSGSNLDDVANGIVVDGSGNVYVTGYSKVTGQGKNMYTIKYNSSGTLQWAQTYNDALNGDDVAAEMAIDNSGNIYVTGYISTAIDHDNFYTIKYDGSGNTIWAIQGDGDAHLNDKPCNIAIDNVGDIVVTGESETTPGTYQYMTVKYTEKSIITPTDYNSESPQKSFQYYRNMGQIINTNDSLEPTIKFYENNSSPEYYIKKNSFSFVFARIDTIPATNDTLHRIDVTFEKVNSSAKAYSLEEQPDYVNYFLGHCPKGITEIHGDERVVTTNLYPNVDLMYSSNQNGIKYYFIVKPGGSPGDIKLDFTGASSFNLNGSTNALTINSSIGSLTFERPTMYQLETNNHVDTLTGWTPAWQTNGANNKYKFYVGSYNTSKPLIIQVDCGHSVRQVTQNGNLEWCSYYGGLDWDYFDDVSTDAQGNVYTSGYSYASDFPTTAGQFANYNGLLDGVIVKFDSSAVPKWANYLGGSNYDRIISNIPDNNGNIYFSGYTNSNNFPHQVNIPNISYIDSTSNGGNDLFIGKFDATAGHPLNWCTYYGGLHDETTGDMAFDKNHNLYVVGQGDTLTPRKIKTGAYNNSIGSGLILRFNYKDSLVWATLYGNNNSVAPHSVGTDGVRDVYIAGTTGNNGIPIRNAGAYIDSTYNGGGYDIFIAKFTATDSLIWSTYYGAESQDEATALTVDTNSNVIITGHTGNASIPTNSFPCFDAGGTAYFDSIYGGISDIFVLKFNSKTQRLWATLYGSTSIEEGYAITHDSKNNIYITGETYASFPTFQLTNAYYQGNNSNGTAADAFILAFDAADSIFWATSFGGYWGDKGRAITTYNSDKLYITGFTASYSNTFPLVQYSNPLAWYQDSLLTLDAFIARFSLILPVTSGVSEIPTVNNDIAVYPNPSSDQVYVDFGKNKVSKICLYSVNGALVFEENIKNKSHEIIDISGLRTGVYFVKVFGDNNVCTKKILKL